VLVRLVRLLVLIGMPLAVASAANVTVRGRCRDGGDAEFRGFGRRVKAAGMCDVDRRCDGFCTFAVNAPCLVRCRLERGCRSPDTAYAICNPDFAAPCPSSVPTVAVRAGERKRVTIGRTTFALRCEPGDACSSTTTTTLPDGVPDLTGDWVLAEFLTADTCPSGTSVRFVRGHVLRLEQAGSVLRGCLDQFGNFHDGGTVSPSGFVLRTGKCCSIVGDGLSFDYATEISGSVPSAPGGLPVSHRVDFFPFPSGPGADPVCGVAAAGLMSRAGPFCSLDAECTVLDACTRCIEHTCIRLRGCRYDPFR
jgi:hypothetical protein